MALGIENGYNRLHKFNGNISYYFCTLKAGGSKRMWVYTSVACDHAPM